MKKIMIVAMMVMALIACDTDNSNYEPFDYTCSLPKGIPDTLATGEKINWNCNWNRAWMEGRVEFVMNDDSTVRLVKRVYPNR